MKKNPRGYPGHTLRARGSLFRSGSRDGALLKSGGTNLCNGGCGRSWDGCNIGDMGVSVLRGFAFAISSASAATSSALVALRLVTRLIGRPLFLIREIGVATLPLYGGQLVGILGLVPFRLAIASGL